MNGRNVLSMFLISLILIALSDKTVAFSVDAASQCRVQRKGFGAIKTSLCVSYSPRRSSSSPRSGKDRSKRQERVGHFVQSALSSILHGGVIKGDAEYLEDELRQRISVVSADLSPDLRQARISVSIRTRKDDSSESNNNPVVDKRRAYAWLVRNTKPIRHTLAQRMAHMKTCPNLSFVQVDVAAAVDVMYLLDKVAAGYKRERIGEFGEDDREVPSGFVMGMDFDEELDEEDWDDEDDNFFNA